MKLTLSATSWPALCCAFTVTLTITAACESRQAPPAAAAPTDPPAAPTPPEVATMTTTVDITLGDPALPGLKPDPALVAGLRRALDAKAADYVPRTHHKDKGGHPQFINRLILQTSPYLLQHAHNPVNWYPWGDAAFERARAEGKPVLMSIGYSTCHWCHVMERESFEDLEIAEYINRNFIAVKVDREERPDVDDIYMKAVNMLTGRGGWPMTTVLTPDRQPFFGGTYFPARTGDRGARKGFLTILKELKARYETDREGAVAEAVTLSRRIAEASRPGASGSVPGDQALISAARNFAGRFDAVWGGFGRAPKFPRPAVLNFLLRYQRRAADPLARTMVVRTLRKMAAGGMHDQLGGGFHRYSTDAHWLVPHFEKMLYDNAQLVSAYVAAWQATADPHLRAVAEKTLDYIAREMTTPKGTFYSATDADSPAPSGHDEEGLFFTWTPTELRALLDEAAAAKVIAWHGVTPRGNFEGRTILHTPRGLGEVAESFGMTGPEFEAEIEAAYKPMYAERLKRKPPIRDDKVLTAWNALMISAFAQAGLAFGRQDYVDRGAAAASFILTAMVDDSGRLLRAFNEGRASFVAYLEDYAFFIQALLDLYEASGELRWFKSALTLQSGLDAHYQDAVSGGYFTTAADAEKLLAREKPTYDGAEPSGNSAALLNLMRLYHFTGEQRWRQQAEGGFEAFSTWLMRRGSASPLMLSALDFYLDQPRQVVVIATDDKAGSAALVDVARQVYLPNRVLIIVGADEVAKHAALIPLLEGKTPMGGRPTAYVCEEGRCEAPAQTADVFRKQLSKIVRPVMIDGAPPAKLQGR